MARKSRGRGTAAAFGLLLLLAGLAGGAVLYVLSVQRPDQAVDGFGRAPIGCTTTLEFTETGTFYVFAERGDAVDVPDGGCQPLGDPSQTFGFELSGPDGPVVPRADTSLSYETDDFAGESVARVQIAIAGRYEIVAVGDDAQVVAAIGRDPNDGVSQLRRLAIAVGASGVLLGTLLLLLAGRRSQRAATFALPDAPVWSPHPNDDARAVVPPTRVAQDPVSPHPALGYPEYPEYPADLTDPDPRPSSPWAPPTLDQAATTPPDQPPGE